MDKKYLKEKYKNEKVFVVPREKLNFIPNGLTTINDNECKWDKFDSMGEYIYRYDAEGEPSVQQIIPYIVITDSEHKKIFATKRIAGDSRLKGSISVGCGGHINEEDGNHEVLFKAAVRELFEELDFDILTKLEIKGYIRDVTSSTNDHTGIFIVTTTRGDISVKEKDTLEGSWMTLDELINRYEQLEGWSKYIVDYFTTLKKDKNKC